MCSIAGIINVKSEPYANMAHHLSVMNHLQRHRGPDDEGIWINTGKYAGFGHRRLSIIDLDMGRQPMSDKENLTVIHNGEIYNYIELRNELSPYPFQTTSDTEVILAAYRKWGTDCVSKLRGMFSFAIWDETNNRLFCARDRFGIKPFYYAEIDGVFYFASEAKAIIPFLPHLETDTDALKEYLIFQLCLDGKTLFKGIRELQPGHALVIENGNTRSRKYWEVYYNLDLDHTEKHFEEKLRTLLEESVELHLRSDVPIGVFLSGGIDSSIIAALASKGISDSDFHAFTGKFDLGDLYDESRYARELAEKKDLVLHELSITSKDFVDSIKTIIYHLDFPVAGPGAFPQYFISKLASQHRKVVLGGQGADEIFGGYTRYLIAYFEQCIKGAIDDTLNKGNFIVTYESIIPNLTVLQKYKPMLKEFWRHGLFEDLDKRYYQLINRAPGLNREINWDELGSYAPFETFSGIFNGNNVDNGSYFDKMTHFDFKTLLPALLQVEDRMSMAHGLESRVPFLDHPLVEFAATIPANIKFKDGTLKRILLKAMKHELPELIVNRKDKMGFPVPLIEWTNGELRQYVIEIFDSRKTQPRRFFNKDVIINNLESDYKFNRKIWGLLSLELWYQEFHDKHFEYQKMLEIAN
ncbi:asparagine synthase (glutamine-hydrolyzing) [Candidatus Parcubacteria bacterium]|nr:MAG: asparagine synthase (glutamine-hydrolyzing) [Candidatus Parcubacteria bacterium]